MLIALVAASAVLGPLAYIRGNLVAPALYDRDAVALTDSVVEIAHGLVLSGPYPLVMWAAPFVLGIWLGRRDLRSRTVRLWLVIGGGVTTLTALALSVALVALLREPGDAVGWDHLVAHVPHSQMPLWLIGATGSAAFVLGVALTVADAAGRAAWPLVATGQLALTVYVGHLLVLRRPGGTHVRRHRRCGAAGRGVHLGRRRRVHRVAGGVPARAAGGRAPPTLGATRGLTGSGAPAGRSCAAPPVPCPSRRGSGRSLDG